MGEVAGHESPGGLSEELVASIRNGDRRAWEDLYLRFRDRILFTVRARLGSALRARLESEDILQSVVRDALEDIDRFTPRGPGSLAHWLHVCVLNKIRNKAEGFAARKRAGEVPLDEGAEIAAAPGGGPEYLDRERFDRLERAMNTLPENLREVVILRRIEGLSNEEAAGVLGKTPEATSKLHARAMARLGLVLRDLRPAPRAGAEG